ncbi:hypothetical protein IL306_005273 [Fusarium sp. DS 682]|nr:hypothetical protein IL306_005273 [Fusarium sp. DS 682]
MRNFRHINSDQKTSTIAPENIANMTESNSNTSGQLQPWQIRALQNGRTPLPESPGERPWLNPSISSEPTRTPATESSTNTAQTSQEPTNTTRNSRYWSDDDMRRLINMRNGGGAWATIKQAFPDRTLEALKQTYHKRRHGLEGKMSEEKAIADATQDKKNR